MGFALFRCAGARLLNLCGTRLCGNGVFTFIPRDHGIVATFQTEPRKIFFPVGKISRNTLGGLWLCVDTPLGWRNSARKIIPGGVVASVFHGSSLRCFVHTRRQNRQHRFVMNPLPKPRKTSFWVQEAQLKYRQQLGSGARVLTQSHPPTASKPWPGGHTVLPQSSSSRRFY